MKHILGIIDTLSEWSGKAFSVLILFIIAILLYEVTMRYLFGNPTIWAHETSQHMFGAYAMMSGAYILLKRQHIRIDILYDHLSSRAKAGVDLFTYLLFFLFIGVIMTFGWQMAWHSLKISEISNTTFHPLLYPVKLTIPIGAFLMLLQGLAHFLRSLIMATQGKELA